MKISSEKKRQKLFMLTIFLLTMVMLFSCNNKYIDSIRVKSISDYDKDTVIDDIETISFGTYPQSDENGNLKEPIEWIVLDTNGGKSLLLSKYILDCKCYDNDFSYGLWEKCSLRKWLNDYFYNLAFDEKEKGMIVSSQLKNATNFDYKTRDGKDTIDKIFCLSIDEIFKYFGKKGKNESGYYKIGKSAVTRGTSYAQNVDNYGSKLYIVSSGDTKGSSIYWLRSAGESNSLATYLMFDIIDIRGGKPSSKGVGVRPAVWISAFSSENKELKKTEDIIKLYNRENNYGFDKVYLKHKEYNFDIDENYYFIDYQENIIAKVHCDYNKKRGKPNVIKSVTCDFYNKDEIDIDYNKYSEPKALKLNLDITNIYDKIGDYLFEARMEYILYNKKHYKK